MPTRSQSPMSVTPVSLISHMALTGGISYPVDNINRCPLYMQVRPDIIASEITAQRRENASSIRGRQTNAADIHHCSL